ncbi:MAG: hypothetical protein ACRCY4_10135 [Brevinema sp.]
MHLGRFLFGLAIILCLGFLFSAQRMDSYEKTLTIRSLTRDLEQVNSRRQELITLIKAENERLVLQSHNIGVPLAPADVVVFDHLSF